MIDSPKDHQPIKHKYQDLKVMEIMLNLNYQILELPSIKLQFK